MVYCKNCGLNVNQVGITCPRCGTSIVADYAPLGRRDKELAFSNPEPSRGFHTSYSMGQSGSLPYGQPAGFWIRFAAAILDSLILMIPQFLLLVALGPGIGDVFSFILVALYQIILVSSSGQGTFGKQILGIIVIDRNGQRLSPAHALGRLLGTYLNILTLGLGYLMIGFSRQKQGLHDKIASTYVVYKMKEQVFRINY